MKMIGTKILIEQEVSAATTAGGLALPETLVHKLPRGTVIAVGDGDVSKSLVGNRVIFNNYAVQTVEVDGKEYAVIDIDDVLVVL